MTHQAGTYDYEPHLAGQNNGFLLALGALIGVIAFGTFGLMIVEPDPVWDFWHSLYFTLITITTVGYSDEGLSPTGKGFTLVLLGLGIATATYAFTQLMQAVVGYQLNWRRRMQKEIDQLRNHLIVCGIGRVGRTVCERLATASLPFVVVENNRENVERARRLGYLTVHGSASDDEMLLLAGIERARGIVCAVDSDSENIVTTLSARELNPDILIISRADRERSVHKIRRAGASYVIAPSLKGGEDIANLLVRPNLAEFLSHGSGYELSEVTIGPGSPLVGMTLEEYGEKERKIVFVAIKRKDGSTQIRPFAGERFHEDDVAIIVGGVPEEVFLALPFDGQAPQGVVHFHEAFQADAEPEG